MQVPNLYDYHLSPSCLLDAKEELGIFQNHERNLLLQATKFCGGMLHSNRSLKAHPDLQDRGYKWVVPGSDPEDRIWGAYSVF